MCFSFFFRNIPRSILISVPIITALYVFMNFSYLTVLSKDEMENSGAVAVEFGIRVFGSFAFLIPLGVSLVCALSSLWSFHLRSFPLMSFSLLNCRQHLDVPLVFSSALHDSVSLPAERVIFWRQCHTSIMIG